MPVFASGTSPYCSPAQFVAFVDARSVGQLLSDNNIPIDPSAFASNATLGIFLQAASGMIESAATVAGAYVIDPTQTPPRNDLASLTGNSATMLAWLVASLAWWMLWSRRPNDGAEEPAQAKMAREWLEQLQIGKRIFGVLDSANAGKMSDHIMTPQEASNLQLPSDIAARYFGRRGRLFSQPPSG